VERRGIEVRRLGRGGEGTDKNRRCCFHATSKTCIIRKTVETEGRKWREIK